jgi:uncharacterized delta-60 repeat protein
VRVALTAAVAVAVSAAAATPAGAITGGAIDSRFASCGQATGLVPRDIAGRQFSYGAGSALAAQPDGKIVAAGPASRGMGATRFNPDGTLDTSFGGDGVAFVPLGGRFDQTRVTAVAIQPDGKVVAAGWLRTAEATSFEQHFVIARFTPSGEPDTTFSGDGLVDEAPAGATTAAVNAIAAAPGGALVLAGEVDGRFAVVRYRDDGTIDPAFGEGGVARVASATRPNGRGAAVFLRPDGRIVAAGHTNAGSSDLAFTVARLTPTGGPDLGFGGTGSVTETFDESSRATALVPLPDGRLYAVGETDDLWGDDEGGGTTRRAAIVRYLENGERDDAFAGDGSVLDALGQGLYAMVLPTAAALDADGRLTVATGRGPLVRYTADGRRDAAFGLGGVLTAFSVPSGDSLLALPDGGLILGGENGRQGLRPAGFEFGPAIMRLAGSGQALESVRGQPGACFLRVRNPSLPHLLRRGRVAKYGKLIVGLFLTQPTPGSGLIRATATAGGSTFEVGSVSFATRYAGSTSFEIKVRKSAYRRLTRVAGARISITATFADRDTAAVTASRTLRR